MLPASMATVSLTRYVVRYWNGPPAPKVDGNSTTFMPAPPGKVSRPASPNRPTYHSLIRPAMPPARPGPGSGYGPVATSVTPGPTVRKANGRREPAGPRALERHVGPVGCQNQPAHAGRSP